jgi:hypothetical protein
MASAESTYINGYRATLQTITCDDCQSEYEAWVGIGCDDNGCPLCTGEEETDGD